MCQQSPRELSERRVSLGYDEKRDNLPLHWQRPERMVVQRPSPTIDSTKHGRHLLQPRRDILQNLRRDRRSVSNEHRNRCFCVYTAVFDEFGYILMRRKDTAPNESVSNGRIGRVVNGPKPRGVCVCAEIKKIFRSPDVAVVDRVHQVKSDGFRSAGAMENRVVDGSFALIPRHFTRYEPIRTCSELCVRTFAAAVSAPGRSRGASHVWPADKRIRRRLPASGCRAAIRGGSSSCDRSHRQTVRIIDASHAVNALVSAASHVVAVVEPKPRTSLR